MAVQLDYKNIQRLAAGLTVLAAAAAVDRVAVDVRKALQAAGATAGASVAAPDAWARVQSGMAAALAGGIIGGFLMAMLLGHAYLTAGNEMSQRPFVRMVALLGALLLLRAIQSGVTALWPWWHGGGVRGFRGLPGASAPALRKGSWTMMMVVARYLVGLAALRGRSRGADLRLRQTPGEPVGDGDFLRHGRKLVVIGEGALMLMGSTGLPF